MGEEEWQELHDESGHVYYFNTRTGVSQWEAPTWIEESDSVSGSVYYVHSVTGEAQVSDWFFTSCFSLVGTFVCLHSYGSFRSCFFFLTGGSSLSL